MIPDCAGRCRPALGVQVGISNNWLQVFVMAQPVEMMEEKPGIGWQ
jgi:hypothetical protein